ncbi:hypothetical protein JAAARDRAFT_36587 [Jaapia argillacea MUCL 33604]|uniref:Uncharacterized protein n=1 Tax=Jaapia argillacea MUCL 33604 TaxID=933084 RepID=A0A067PNQ6_9AGAM|nr:hypothetical protein JAAARDRAFT_36587 [Jaapia argillacea MUCL 33604]
MPFTLPSEPTPFSFFTDNDPKPFTFPMHPTPFSRPTSPISTPLPPSRSQSPIQQALNFVTRHLAFELDLDERIQGEREQEDVGRLEIYVTREVLVVSEVDERRGMGRRGW